MEKFLDTILFTVLLAQSTLLITQNDVQHILLNQLLELHCTGNKSGTRGHPLAFDIQAVAQVFVILLSAMQWYLPCGKTGIYLQGM